MEKMTKQEFEAIYTDKLTAKQRRVLKEFLQNKPDQQIANSLTPKVTKHCVSVIFQIFASHLISKMSRVEDIRNVKS
jgi:FixJ family two-component response regulator